MLAVTIFILVGKTKKRTFNSPFFIEVLIMTYTTKQGETWDEVSYKVYGTDEFTHILLKAN